MLQAWVDKNGRSFIVRTGKVTPYGFMNVRQLDKFGTLPEAKKKAELANYIFEKCSGLAGAR